MTIPDSPMPDSPRIDPGNPIIPKGKMIGVEEGTGYLIFKVKDSEGNEIEKKYRLKVMQGDTEITPAGDKIQLSHSVADLLNKKWGPSNLTTQDLSKYVITKSAITDISTQKIVNLEANDFETINNLIFNILKKTHTEKPKTTPKDLTQVKIEEKKPGSEEDNSWAITKFFKNLFGATKAAPKSDVIEEEEYEDDYEEERIELEERVEKQIPDFVDTELQLFIKETKEAKEVEKAKEGEEAKKQDQVKPNATEVNKQE